MRNLRYEDRPGYPNGFYWEDLRGSTHYIPLETKDHELREAMRGCILKREEILSRESLTVLDLIALESCNASIRLVAEAEKPLVYAAMRRVA